MSENSICVYEIVGEDNCPPYSEDRFYAFPCDEEGACAEEVRIPADETCPHDTVFVLVQNRCDWDRAGSTAERDTSPRSPALRARGEAVAERGALSGDELAAALGSANAALDGLADGSVTDEVVLLDAIEVLASQLRTMGDGGRGCCSGGGVDLPKSVAFGKRRNVRRSSPTGSASPLRPRSP
jgi:hypothetical protein